MECWGFLIYFSCQVAAPPPPTDSFCAIYKPIHLSHADTRRTKEQADSHNRVWKRVCSQR